MEDEKWLYIRKISQMSDSYGDKLIDLMVEYDCDNLMEVQGYQAKEFYYKLTGGKKTYIKYEPNIWR